MIIDFIFLLISTLLPIGFVADMSGFFSVKLLRKVTWNNLIWRNIFIGFFVGSTLGMVMARFIPVIETGLYVSGIIGGGFGVYGALTASGKCSLYFWKESKYDR